MSLAITLYESCKLSNKYTQVFKDRTTMATYLATLTYSQIYSGDDIYYTNSGTISIDNTTLTGNKGDKYNYIEFTETDSNGTITKRYGFVNKITLIDTVAVIEYEEDIWHTYAISTNSHNINLFNSLLIQAKTINGGTGYEYTLSEVAGFPKQLPTAIESQHPPKFYDTLAGLDEKWCYIVVVGSMYKLSAQGEVNQRFSSCYLLSRKESTTNGITPDDSAKEYFWKIDNQVLDILITLKAKSSDTHITNHLVNENNWNYEIADIILIPDKIGASIFNSVTSSDSTHDDELYQDFELTINYHDFASGSGALANFDTEVGFNNLILESRSSYISGGVLKYTHNGFLVNQKVEYNTTFKGDYKYMAIGNYSRTLSKEFEGYTNCQAKYEFCFNQYDASIKLFFKNEIFDITSDLKVNLPISVVSADITQQQKIAREVGNMTGLIGMARQTISGVSSISNMGIGTYQNVGNAQTESGATASAMSGGISIGASALNTMYGLLSSSIQLSARNQPQYLTNSVNDVNDIAMKNCILGILREIEIDPNNQTLIDKMINTYGYIYRVIVNKFDTVYVANNYVKFAQANVYGNFSQSIARGLERILENGIVLL